MWNNLFKPMDTLQRGLSASWLRNAVIRNNIANVETPNFKASDVHFESLLRNSLLEGGFEGYRTHEKHVPIGRAARERFEDVVPRITENRELSMRMDGNNVDIESENVKMAQNQLYYNTLMEKLNGEVRRLRMAISEGR